MSESVAEARHHPLGAAALHALVDLAPDGIFVADAAGRYLYVNDAGCAMLGYTRQELMLQRIQQAVPETDLGRLARARAAMIEGPTGATEWTLRRKDGSLLPVEVTARILPDGQWQGFVRDISERKALQAEREALFQQVDADRRQLQTLVDTLPIAVMLYQADGSIVANRRCEELLGMPLPPAAGSAQYADRIFFADGRPVPHDQLMSARVRRGETVIAEEFMVRRPDGSELPVLASAAPITDAGGQTIGGVGVFQDMSERMRLERAVRDNEHLLKSVFDI
ncbi:MAG TPA: PAS domain S-box protein, partial [Ramlibacter sp.]